ncbi:MAG: discoidin domain-containing protein, partial [Bacteroidota bacterium]|nr:discoidin domain-containing protein [Bacteroidota bacterium]
MKVIYTVKIRFEYNLILRFLFLLCLLIPIRSRPQSISPQPCSQDKSWIARWTLASVSGGIAPSKMCDGDKTTCEDINTPGPWVYTFDFGIIRHLSGIKVYSNSGLYSPHAYQVFVSQDNLTFTQVTLPGTLPYAPGSNENTIDFNGFVDAQYVRIVITDAFQSSSAFNNARLRLWEVNFIQCGVDPLIAKPITPGAVVTPALSCADAISKDIQG